ncbi:MAG: DUF2341 domain-containing protein, partial [Bacteroidales bacterium]|nr:DUF2341 domain-containing protein [Bacteroidales bacterium]
NYRIPIYIQNSSPNVLNDYQVLIKFASNSLISSGKMQANCADIRITDADGCTLLNFWIEGGLNSSSTFVWTKVPSIPANGVKIIYLYYGNPSASSASIGQSTFLFFDDFLGTTLDPSRWITTGHSGYLPMFYTVSGGILTEWSDNQWRILAANYTSATNELIAVEAKISKSNSSRWHVHYLVQGSDANNARFGIVDDGYPGLNIGIQVKCPSGSYELPYDLGPILNDVWYTMRILRKSSIHFYADVLSSTTREIVNSTAFFEHQRTCWSTIPNWRWVNWQSSNVQVKYDWIFIRKYQDPEPNLIVGSEEVYNPSPSLRNSIFVHPQTGNVGINTTTPGFYTLFVEGLAFARGGWFSSDARLKHFIQPIQESYTQRLLKLTPVQFKWNQNAYPSKRFPSGQHFGLLAQEVEKIFPDLVMQDPINEKSVAYIEFIPLLIAAYQNMHKTLESYKQDIQNLQRENQMLKGEINNLKTKLSKP